MNKTSLEFFFDRVIISVYALTLYTPSLALRRNLSISFLIGLIFFGFKFMFVLSNRKLPSFRNLIKYFFFFFLFLIFNEYLIHDASILINYFITFGLNILILALLVDSFCRNNENRKFVLHVFSLGGVLVSSLILLGVGTLISQSGRVTFLGGNENEIGITLLFAYAWMSMNLLSVMNRSRLLVIIAHCCGLTLILLAIFASGTRFATVGLVVISVLLFTSAFIKSDTRASVLLHTLLVLGVVLFTVIGDKQYRQIDTNPHIIVERWDPKSVGNNLDDLGGRTQMWKDAYIAFKARPFLGQGYSGFQEFLSTGGTQGLPHNFFLEIMATSGLVGVAILCVIVINTFLYAINSFNQTKNIYILILSALLIITAFMLNITTFKAFWFFLAVLFSQILNKKLDFDNYQCV